MCLPYSTRRATRCVKSPAVKVEKIFPDKFLIAEKMRHELCCSVFNPYETPCRQSRLGWKQRNACFQFRDYSQFGEAAQIEKHVRGEAANPVVGQVPTRTKKGKKHPSAHIVNRFADVVVGTRTRT